jgi:hypothetical protein
MTKASTICLVGPRRSGKSAMLATLADCVVQQAHGYPADLRPTLQPITRAAFHGFESAAAKLDILDAGAEDYQKLRRSFAEGGTPTDAKRLEEYFFRLTLNNAARQERPPHLLRIVDAAGSVAVPDDAAPPEAPSDVREAFAARLHEADAIVFVLPFVRFADSVWIAGLARLVERLARASERARRIVVALSHYERLFVRLGPSAFTYACDPAVALYSLRRALQAAPWIDSLRALDGDGRALVRFTTFSAYGFCKTHQIPNIDPHAGGEQRFRRAGVAGPRAFNEFWRPFLTADPILSAALDQDSAFMFSFAQIDGDPRKKVE